MKVYMIAKTINVIDNSNHSSKIVKVVPTIMNDGVVGVYSSRKRANEELEKDENRMLFTFEVQ